jgi:hypothetical protein
MPLNYSKWDALEVRRILLALTRAHPVASRHDIRSSPSLSLQLSDDSDIEEHPNIDKKSMIRQAISLLSFSHPPG